MTVLVSAVLGSYNRKNFLKKAIQSIRSSRVDFNYEIIVVDGGSTDGSIEWLMKQKDLITIVQHNRGVWQGKQNERKSWGYFMNLGFKCAQGKYILMLSDDCLIHPDAMANGVSFFEKRIAEGVKLGAVPFYWRNWPKDKKYYVISINNNIYLNHGLYLKKALEDVNYINEDDYMFYCADVDLSFRIREEGYLVEATEKSLVEHYHHANMVIRRTNEEIHKKDIKTFERRWADFLRGQKSIDVSSLIESEVKPNDDFVNRSFGSSYWWYRFKSSWGIKFFYLYHSVRNRI